MEDFIRRYYSKKELNSTNDIEVIGYRVTPGPYSSCLDLISNTLFYDIGTYKIG